MKVLIVDDEPLARIRLLKMLQKLGFTDCFEAKNGHEAIKLTHQHVPDLILLDIQMPILGGLDAARLIKQQHNEIPIVFCTAYDEFAIDAFDLSVDDYLLKPVSMERLSQAISKAGLNSQAENRLELKRGNKTLMSPLKEICLFIADGKYITACLGETEYMVDSSLLQLEKKFPNDLVRIHRNTLVNVNALIGVQLNQDGKYLAILKNSSIRPIISRRKLPLIKKHLKKP